jgi:hypothetical protein
MLRTTVDYVSLEETLSAVWTGIVWKKERAVWGKQKITAYWMIFKFEEGTGKILQLEHGLYGAETWTLRAADQK